MPDTSAPTTPRQDSLKRIISVLSVGFFLTLILPYFVDSAFAQRGRGGSPPRGGIETCLQTIRDAQSTLAQAVTSNLFSCTRLLAQARQILADGQGLNATTPLQRDVLNACDRPLVARLAAAGRQQAQRINAACAEFESQLFQEDVLGVEEFLGTDNLQTFVNQQCAAGFRQGFFGGVFPNPAGSAFLWKATNGGAFSAAPELEVDDEGDDEVDEEVGDENVNDAIEFFDFIGATPAGVGQISRLTRRAFDFGENNIFSDMDFNDGIFSDMDFNDGIFSDMDFNDGIVNAAALCGN